MLVNKPSSIVGKSGFFLPQISFFLFLLLVFFLPMLFLFCFWVVTFFFSCWIFFSSFPLCHLFLIDLGQNQQQHLTVHSEGVCREKVLVVAVEVSDM